MTGQTDLRCILICLPGAGRTRTAYGHWLQHLPPNITLCPLELPTFGYKDTQSLQDRANDLAAQLHRDGLLEGQHTIGIFGHSLGALVGYELTRALHDRAISCLYLFAAAAKAPHLMSGSSLLDEPDIDDDTLVARLIELDEVSIPLLDPSIREVLLPKIRADLRLVANYRWGTKSVLPISINVFGGENDPSVTTEELAAWAELSTRPVRVQMFAGRHFFVDRSPVELCHVITETMHQPVQRTR